MNWAIRAVFRWSLIVWANNVVVSRSWQRLLESKKKIVGNLIFFRDNEVTIILTPELQNT